MPVIALVLLDGLTRLRLSSPQAHLVPVVVGLVVLVPVAWWGGRRLGGSGALASLAACALVAAIQVTLVRLGPPLEDGQLAFLRSCRITDAAVLTPEGVLNLFLLAPAAFLAVLAVGRPLVVSTGLILVSVGIEATQAIASVGVCDSSDVVHNAAGAIGAAAVAGLLRTAWRSGSSALRAA